MAHSFRTAQELSEMSCEKHTLIIQQVRKLLEMSQNQMFCGPPLTCLGWSVLEPWTALKIPRLPAVSFKQVSLALSHFDVRGLAHFFRPPLIVSGC